jgi:metal-responsive CopG/Arc/MetJ family transcriptional regulator
MKKTRVPVTVSVPSDLAAQFEKLARTEAKNKSQLFRDMFAAYRLQRYGVRQARKKGVLTETDVEALVFQGR